MTFYEVKYYNADGREYIWHLWNKNGSVETAAMSVLSQLPNEDFRPVIVNTTYAH